VGEPDAAVAIADVIEDLRRDVGDTLRVSTVGAWAGVT
jgi:hypothetical protein